MLVVLMEERLSILKTNHLEKLRIGMVGVPPLLSDSRRWIKGSGTVSFRETGWREVSTTTR